MTSKIGLYRLQSGHIFNGKLHCCYGRRQWRYVSAKVLIHLLPYLIFNMTLFTGKQRRHMMNIDDTQLIINYVCILTVKTCTPPATVDNAIVFPARSTYTYGDAITYTCDEGYLSNTVGPLIRHCTDTDTWNGTAPVCEG